MTPWVVVVLCAVAIVLGMGLAARPPARPTSRAAHDRASQPRGLPCPSIFQRNADTTRTRHTPEVVLARWRRSLLSGNLGRVQSLEEEMLRRKEEHRLLLSKTATQDLEEEVRKAAAGLLERFANEGIVQFLEGHGSEHGR